MASCYKSFMGEGHLRKKKILYSIIRIVTPFPRIEIHVNTGNMYVIQVTNKTFIRNELCSGFKTQGLEYFLALIPNKRNLY